ncbi:MAG TPA: SGNH/GDSL hydrolase family protein [Anaeromyxobacteraceae bacterium]|nr:SGNH/GDSL hydrolase family protein [Anaeromyxobacteraceae bacterium]
MPKRPTAREIEADAAGRRGARGPPGPLRSEPLRMLRRRGLAPSLARPDLPLPPGAGEPLARAFAARLRHYAFRLFLRGAILAPGGFAPGRATRYVPARTGRRYAEELVAWGLARRLPGGRYRLLYGARSFGGTLEWWLARELRERLGFEVEVGVRSGARGVGGDLDVVAAAEGKLVYLETKSSPPKHILQAEVEAFLRRVRAVRPDVALFVVDTALRLSDKVLPMFADALGEEASAARRMFRETWALGPHLFVVNAREDLVENVCRAVAEGIRNLGPDFPLGADARRVGQPPRG